MFENQATSIVDRKKFQKAEISSEPVIPLLLVSHTSIVVRVRFIVSVGSNLFSQPILLNRLKRVARQQLDVQKYTPNGCVLLKVFCGSCKVPQKIKGESFLTLFCPRGLPLMSKIVWD